MIDSYKTLPIGKYLDIVRINEGDADNLQKQVETIAVLSDCAPEDVLALPLGEYKERACRASFLDTLTPDDAGRMADEYRLGDFELVPVKDARKIITAQYVDFQEYIKREGNIFVEMISCMLIPKGKRYGEGYDITEVQAAIRDSLTVADALALSAFFLNLFDALMLDSLNYSEVMAQGLTKAKRTIATELIQAAKMRFQISGGGLRMLMRPLRRVAAAGRKSGRCRRLSSSTSSHTA